MEFLQGTREKVIIPATAHNITGGVTNAISIHIAGGILIHFSGEDR